MNAVATEITSRQDDKIDKISNIEILLNPAIIEQMNALATLMANSKVTVPSHLQKLPGDCLAIIMQAAMWKMSPFAVAQKTHLVNGTLGYEAQLVNAVVSSSNAIKGRFKYEYKGDWSRHNNAGSDAAIRVGAVLSGEEEITWGEWLLVGNVAVKNSPLWKSAPKQQGAYLAVKYWARLYCPEIIMGVYSVDELEPEQPREKVINPQHKESDSLVATINAVTVDDILSSIGSASSLKDLDALTEDIKNQSNDDIKIIRSAWSKKSKSLKAKSEKPDYRSELASCKDAEALNALWATVPEADKMELSDFVDQKFDSFRVAG